MVNAELIPGLALIVGALATEAWSLIQSHRYARHLGENTMREAHICDEGTESVIEGPSRLGRIVVQSRCSICNRVSDIREDWIL